MGELMNENQLIDQNEYHKILFPGIRFLPGDTLFSG